MIDPEIEGVKEELMEDGFINSNKNNKNVRLTEKGSKYIAKYFLDNPRMFALSYLFFSDLEAYTK